MKNIEDDCKKESRSINITIILMRLIGMWHVNDRKEQIISNITLAILLMSMSIATFIESDEMYYAKTNLRLLTYVAPCASAVLSEFSKLLVFVYNRKKVMELNKFTEECFWRADYNETETKIFNKCDRLSFKAILLYIFVLQGICWHYLLAPIFESMGKNSSERTFPFPIYVDLPLTVSPYYEIVYSLQVFGTMSVCLCATTFASFLFTTNLFAAAQFKILCVHLQSLCDFSEDTSYDKNLKFQADSYEKLKNCIQKHQLLINYIDKIEALYCFVMLGQIFGSVTQICFSGFQIILSNSNDVSLQRIILSIEYLIGSFLQLYFYCYSSHKIFNESENVSESMYSSKWFKISHTRIQKDFSQLVQIIVHRARRPCTLTVGKFCPLTLDTFSSVLNTSLSYFTVLRQTIE